MERSDVVKKIAQLVRAGAALTPYTCPACGTVLVRLKTGELYCANCEKTVVLVKTEEEAQEKLEVIQLREVRRIVFDKILQLGRELEKLSASEMVDHLRSMSLLLDIYERLSRVQSESSRRHAAT
ncbi:Sjogren's syndrome/scleroderma autoantigen 1 family protein [Pyrobaculum neutrophilum]|uniref:Sjogrens syndrome scleroderma autoantigen 1 n=1 Tax=Pyrobaculum neutrophilum (strain DSM 2338 / JCM 9278 / NBRC 100436 / V24Sta) TaxID=444157 RepID=B1YCV5_PYRNV|nr:Sjogren's syndrome/scleroderma autoantigen 1 family protein [Pyrobaculum neutrophilum]ACB39618.1 Sjogrens syndrome scleroderma autoantigen 1 [Pyrobaculum neutrophilum V24Sta]